MADPYLNYNFVVEIDGIQRAAFQEVSGLDSTIEVTEYSEGGDTTPRKLPGRTTYSNIVLKWGISDDTDLYDWHRRVAESGSEIERKDGAIVLQDRRGQEVRRWDFFNAWPTVWNGPDLNAASSEVAIETLELAHERVVQA